MAVRIRMKKMGRAHRPFFRICAIDKRSPRDGRVLEELGTYDPMVEDTDARAQLDKERVDYWLSVGAQPSEKVAVLIKKYGKDGTHLDKQQAALDKLSAPREVPDAGKPASLPQQPEPPQASEGESGSSESAATDSPEKTETPKAAEAPEPAEATEQAEGAPAADAAQEKTPEPEAKAAEPEAAEADKATGDEAKAETESAKTEG